MPLYHYHKPVLQHKWPLLQVCYKPYKIAASMSTWDNNAFFTRINPWKYVEKIIKFDKVIQRDFFFTKLSVICSCKKCIDIPRWPWLEQFIHAYEHHIICMAINQKMEVAFQNAAVELRTLHNLLWLSTADYTSFSWH